MEAALPSDLRHGYLQNDDVRLHYVEAGPKDGHLVLLLHGFPSFWYTWKHQIGPLAQRGFHVVAPDLRGYNLSSKPEGVAAYGRQPVSSDITALQDHLGGKGSKCTLVGHDWGGNIAWAYAHDFPERLERLVVLNMPHPSEFAKALRTDPGQMRRSWYIFLFQLPSFGETMVTVDNFRFLRKLIREDPIPPQSADVVQAHVDAFSHAGAVTASINYYRAIFRHWMGSGSQHPKVEIPVLVLWGDKDNFFQPYLTDPPRDVVPHATVVRFPNASHWVMWDEAEAVTSHILDFLGGGIQSSSQQMQSRL